MGRFHVPQAESGIEEEIYASFAALCGCEVPPHGERVESIAFEADGIRWVATVGSPMEGTEYPRKRSGRPDYDARPRHHREATTVLAIFPSRSFQVVTTQDAPTEWANPLDAGQPIDVRCFDTVSRDDSPAG